MTCWPARYRGVLLDIDGTLVDSNDAHAEAWAETLAMPVTRVRPLIGMGGDKLITQATGLTDDRRIEQLGAARSKVFRERWLRHVRPQPGARALVLALLRRSVRVTIATAAREEEARALLAIAGIADLVGDPLTSSEVARSKPDPDVVFAALQRLAVGAHQAVLVGDTRFDIAAARDAGVDTIALRCGGALPAELVGAIAVFRDPAHLAARLASPDVRSPKKTTGPTFAGPAEQ